MASTNRKNHVEDPFAEVFRNHDHHQYEKEGNKSSNIPTPLSYQHTQHDYENPWESAANDRLWEVSNTNISMSTSHTNINTHTNTNSATTPNALETSMTAYLNGDTNHDNDDNNNHHHHHNNNNSCAFTCFQACHVLDIISGSIMVLYTILAVYKVDRIPAIFLLTISSLWIIRGIVAKTTRCGVSLSATTSMALALLYVILALGLWGMSLHNNNNNNNNNNNCLLLPNMWCHQSKTSSTTLAFLLVLLAVYEGIRYLWIKQWMWQESTQIRDDLSASRNSTNYNYVDNNDDGQQRRRQRRRHSSPWWWASYHTEPLLSNYDDDGGAGGGGTVGTMPHWTTSNNGNGYDYHIDSGVGSPIRNGGGGSFWWSLFGGGGGNNRTRSGRRGRRGRTSSDLRDDGSVDYASLNEDWASRSQQDPFWWTRDNYD